MLEVTQMHARMTVVDRPPSARADPHRAAATEFEAIVLAELLRAAGAGKPISGIESGVGEDQFASFLVDAQARAIAAQGGIGLAEMMIRASDRNREGE
ncbi:rod-binding protein [Roseinatronobacter alkalisoli]|uniref:Rod-binding protein n=1 Tax=Roseinatronobacter alkalisoli TaxID=3028235 RepID=A0ABT5T9T9_9RHOB|nr:rod-binding protein [Roseinatronobacter sp. HJB301]MDD7971734.1 rod-binding protein [Roseinatronobacter sp. HJB301]